MKALVSGTLAAAAVTIVASVAGRRRIGSYPAPLNATSHFLWGRRAARRTKLSWKYTGVGFAANWGASIFWALFYEKLKGPLAYVTDYHVVPRRLTPGFEMRLPNDALAGIYVALALALSARDLLGRR